MTVSAAFTVGGSITPGGTVTLTLNNPSGINGVVWSVVGNDKSIRVNPVITPAGSSPPGSTASFTFPTDPDGLGQAYDVQCFVTDAGNPANTDTSRQVVGIAGPNGLIPGVSGEELERSPTYGWLPLFNGFLTGVEPRVGAPPTITADVTATVVLSAPIAAGTVNRLLVRWMGRRSDGLAVAARESVIYVYRLAGGNVTQLGATVDLLATAKTDATWGALDFVLNAGTQAVDIRVAGKAATNITWYVSYSKLAY